MLSAIDEVLAAHMRTFGRAEQVHPKDGPNCGWASVRVCRCGQWSTLVMHDESDLVAHRAHVASMLAQAGVGVMPDVNDLRHYLSTHGGAIDESDTDAMADFCEWLAGSALGGAA